MTISRNFFYLPVILDNWHVTCTAHTIIPGPTAKGFVRWLCKLAFHLMCWIECEQSSLMCKTIWWRHSHHVTSILVHMMTSPNGNIFRVTSPLCREFLGTGEFPYKGQSRGALMFSVTCTRINGWVNNREAGGLRRPLWLHFNDMMSLGHKWVK